jgi:hypothetical protein
MVTDPWGRTVGPGAAARPVSADDWVKIIGALASASVVLIGAMGALYVKIEQIHRVVNSRMTELLDLTRRSARAQGQLERATLSSPGPISSDDSE